MAKKKYYAVKIGLTPGIYETWAECEANVKGYPKAEYKGFATLDEAKEYMGSEGEFNQLDVTTYFGDVAKGGSVDNTLDITSYIGQDEVGRGEPFRRVIVVAAYLDGNHLEELKKIGATNDSKNYGLDTDKCVKIGKLLTHFTDYKEVENKVYENENLGITYSIYSIDNSYYNILHEQDNKMNGNKILAIMHNRAGFNLANYLGKKGIVIRNVVIDNFLGVSNASKNYAKYVENEKYRLDTSGVNMVYETKSESKYEAVAVASNIANYLEQLYVDMIRKQIREKGGDLDSHAFSNGVEDVQYAFDEIVKVYGTLDNPNIEEEFKHTVYYENYINTGKVH